MKKNISSVGVAMMLMLSLMPVAVSAQSVSDLQNQIQILMSQIKGLQEKINGMQNATSTPMDTDSSHMPMMDDQHSNNDNQGETPRACPELKRNLSVGSRGDDVKAIQGILAQDKTIFVGTTTGYFGPETAKGVMRFQKKFGIASSSTGFVGKMTREFFGKKCPPPFGNGNNGGRMGENRRMAGGIVSANDGTTISVTIKDGSTKSVNTTVNTVVLKWTGTTTPPVTGVVSDATVGSSIGVEGKEVSMGVFTASTIRVGFPIPPQNGQGGETSDNKMMRRDDHMGTSTMGMPPRQQGDQGGDQTHMVGSSQMMPRPQDGGGQMGRN